MMSLLLELKFILAILFSLWGISSMISVIFPYKNVLVAWRQEKHLAYWSQTLLGNRSRELHWNTEVFLEAAAFFSFGEFNSKFQELGDAKWGDGMHCGHFITEQLLSTKAYIATYLTRAGRWSNSEEHPLLLERVEIQFQALIYGFKTTVTPYPLDPMPPPGLYRYCTYMMQ